MTNSNRDDYGKIKLTSSSLEDSSELELSDSERPPKNLDIVDRFFYSVKVVPVVNISNLCGKYHIPKKGSIEHKRERKINTYRNLINARRQVTTDAEL